MARNPQLRMILVSVWLLTSALVCAQTGVSLEVGRIDATTLEIGWPVASLVPKPGLQLFAQYQLQSSLDLIQWQAAGPERPGINGLAGRLSERLSSRQGALRFYRVAA